MCCLSVIEIVESTTQAWKTYMQKWQNHNTDNKTLVLHGSLLAKPTWSNIWSLSNKDFAKTTGQCCLMLTTKIVTLCPLTEAIDSIQAETDKDRDCTETINKTNHRYRLAIKQLDLEFWNAATCLSSTSYQAALNTWSPSSALAWINWKPS